MNEKYNDIIELDKFISSFLTNELIDKFHIKSVEKTNLCYRGKGLLVPLIEFFVKGFSDATARKTLEEDFIAAFQNYFHTDLKPGIVFQNAALWVREYQGRYYHLSVAEDSNDRDFVDYILFEITKEGYDAILNSRYAYCNSPYDEKYIKRFYSTDEAYMEIYRHCLSEKLLQNVVQK